MQNQVQKMLDKGVIRHSIRHGPHPRFWFQKNGPDGKSHYRFCLDFRALNSVTRLDPYPLPLLEEATSTLYRSKYFSVFDC